MDMKWFATGLCISLIASGHVGYGNNDFETPLTLTYSSVELLFFSHNIDVVF